MDIELEDNKQFIWNTPRILALWHNSKSGLAVEYFINFFSKNIRTEKNPPLAQLVLSELSIPKNNRPIYTSSESVSCIENMLN